MGLCVVGPVGLIGPLSGGLVGLVVQWIWWAVGLVVGPRVWWACGSGGFCGVLTAKSPTLRGPTCQGVLGLVFFKCLEHPPWQIQTPLGRFKHPSGQ